MLNSKATGLVLIMLILSSSIFAIQIALAPATETETSALDTRALATSPTSAYEATGQFDEASGVSGETTQYGEDKWSFNDTQGWSKLAYVNGNMTRLNVGFDGESSSLAELDKIATRHQAKRVANVAIGGKLGVAVYELPLVSTSAFADEVDTAGLASYVEPSMTVQTQFAPNDPYWNSQWGPKKIEADYAWNTTLGSSFVTVAIVDTGIYYYNPDLSANYVRSGYDWVNNDSDPLDDNGHGTHVAGIIAAEINNGVGIAGMAQVRIMAEKVLDAYGNGFDVWVASGITHAVDNGAKIISLSLGGYGESEVLYQAVKYAYDSGVLIVAAAGNDNTNTKLYPAAYEEVIAVAATDESDAKAYFSNWGDWIELAAPGVNIFSTYMSDYVSLSGTSMATPHVSGLAALAWSRFPNKTRDWVRLWLRYATDDLGEPGFDMYYGFGRINCRKAIEQNPPDHELIASKWATPPYARPGESVIINATVLNLGEKNETDLTVQLLANSTVVDSTYIINLNSEDSAQTALSWNPIEEGLYNVAVRVLPVPNETSVENNVLSKIIYVGFPVIAVVLHSAGNIQTNIITNWQVFSNEWYLFGSRMIYVDYKTLNHEGITYEDIADTKADVLIISCAYDPYAGWQFTDAEIDAITQYVKEGHGLVVTAGTLYYQVPNNNKLALLLGINDTTAWVSTGTDLYHILNATHPIFSEVPDPLVFPTAGTAVSKDNRWDRNELAGGKYLALGHFQEGAIVTYKGLVYISAWLEVIPPYYRHHLQALYNAILWSKYTMPQHELVVSLQSPEYLQPGESTTLNATVSNMGLSNETDIELDLQIGGASVRSTVIPELTAGTSVTIDYFWNPYVERFYNITAYSPPLPEEEYTFNNRDSAILYVRQVRFVLWDDTKDDDGDSLSGNYLFLYQLLTLNGFVVDELTAGPLNSVSLAKYDILVLMDPELGFTLSEIRDIQEWITAGGAAIIIPDAGYPTTLNTLMIPYGVQMTGRVGGWGITLERIDHPITQGVTQIYVDLVRDISVTPPSTTLAWTADSFARYTFLSASDGGEVVVVSDSNIMDNNLLGMADNTRLTLNIFNWVGIKSEHDLSVSMVAPAILKPGNSVLLNATVRNRGLSDEAIVEFQLFIDGSAVDSVVIPELPSGASYEFSYSWKPDVEATYNVTAYAVPVSGESIIVNNQVSKLVEVLDVLIVEVLDSYGTDFSFDTCWDYLNTNWASYGNVRIMVDYTSLNKENITLADIEATDADVLVISDAWDRERGWEFQESEIEAIRAYVGQGHGIIATSGTFDTWSAPNNQKLADLFGMDSSISYNWGYDGEQKDTEGTFNLLPLRHSELWRNISDPYVSGPQATLNPTPSSDWEIQGVTAGWTEALSTDHYAAVITNDVYYKAVFFTCMLESLTSSFESNRRLFYNAIVWAQQPVREHDIASSLAAPDSLALGGSVLLNASVINLGMSNETNVELDLLVNGVIVDFAVISQLQARSSQVLSYLWAPLVGGVYNITSFAPTVAGEDFTTNNRETKSVRVRSAHDLVTSLSSPLALELGDIANITVIVLNDGLFDESNVTVGLIINGSEVEKWVLPWVMIGMSSERRCVWIPVVEGVYNVTGYALPLAGEESALDNVQSVDVTVYPGVGPTYLWVSPSSLTVASNSVFKVNATVSNVNNFYGFEFKLSWNTSVLDLVEVNLYLPWSTSFLVINETLEEIGRYWIAASGQGPAFPFYGSTNLVTLSFKSTMPGSSKLDLYDTKLGSSSATPIPHAVLDGFVVVEGASVSKPGDVNGDGFVDINDIITVAAAFGSQIGQPDWNPKADTNGDNIIDIFDLVYVAVRFGT